ncbi:alpha/beta fold hydrolase [Amycolatopsis granulosa]|uniref:alpha/beta fold hydrolase n=1 Tax=Amycolatopsis granulosa TaxID=185684 RepID=UPI0014212B07|nr:alpha/beta fold hydrolase [Amycolatopsis granulosa]NIH88334.1 pimeloyl-ACP methyl ester carboxylesterase [Amycolatopsis granulosa]
MRQTEGGLPSLGQHVDAAGHRLWVHRSGTGGPAVVFLPGAGAIGLDYLLAHERIAEFTTSIIYDRAGTGWSEDTALPRSLDEVTDELRALLRAVEVPPPYVFVGHSLGGAYTQRYTQRFPGEVAALLHLEPLHPDYDDYMPEHLKLSAGSTAEVPLPELTDDLVALARAQFESGMLDAFPDGIRSELIGKHTSPDRLLTGVREGANVLALLDELRAGGPVPDVPVIVLSATAVGAEQMIFQSEDNLREQVAGSQRLFEAITAATPHGEHRVLADASHITIPMVRADAVADAARDLLNRIQASEIFALRARADNGDGDAIDELIELATEQGDMNELRRLADRGNSDAADQLIELATERDDTNELRRLAELGNTTAAQVLSELTAE